MVFFFYMLLLAILERQSNVRPVKKPHCSSRMGIFCGGGGGGEKGGGVGWGAGVRKGGGRYESCALALVSRAPRRNEGFHTSKDLMTPWKKKRDKKKRKSHFLSPPPAPHPHPPDVSLLEFLRLNSAGKETAIPLA